ncbi:hypothetical protein KKF04_02675, partial [Patescibacteria group bacterium]|nr:hypothetical protein [Patescibacteria group bacterium]
LVGLVLGFILINTFSGIFEDKVEPPSQIETPAFDTPPANIETNKLLEVKKIELLSKSYIPSENPYGYNYLSEANRLTIGGEFIWAKINIRGETVGEGYRFLTFNFGQESGLINAVRKSKNRLDVKKTIEKGGAFNSNNPINVTIDLLSITEFGTTQDEYETNGATKFIKFWDKMKLLPPTVTYLLVAPFTETGKYGGASINSIEIEYACKEGSECKIELCPSSMKATSCLAEQLGIEAMNDWCTRSKLCN